MASGGSSRFQMNTNGQSGRVFDNEDSSGASSGEEWEEMDCDPTEVDCLFCDQIFKDVESALPHCAAAHQFDLARLKVSLNLDDYSYIKLINYIRRNKLDPKTDLSNSSKWNTDENLQMVVPNDPWICFDIEDLAVSEIAKIPDSQDAVNVCAASPASSNGNLSSTSVNELESTISQLKLELQDKESRLVTAAEEFKKMKQLLQSVVLDDEQEDKKSVPLSVKAISAPADYSYFDSYADFDIHREMLMDRVRTSSYKNAIMKNSETFRGKTVLDVGCGTGILSMFAADAGAEKVIGIDMSNIIYNAMDVIRVNGFKNGEKIELVKGKIEDTELPVDKVDIIISEWMGYFLLFENMLDSIVYARDHHLKQPGGIIMPNRFSLELLGASDMLLHDESLKAWDNCYGYNLSFLREEYLEKPIVRTIEPDKIITSSSVLLNLDVYTCDTNSVNFSSTFKLNVLRKAQLTCLVGYFDTFFEMQDVVSFSTGPKSTPTHWKQTVFLLPEPVNVSEGQIIEGTLVCRRHPKELRSLLVKISIFDLKLKFTIN